MNTWTEQQAKG